MRPTRSLARTSAGKFVFRYAGAPVVCAIARGTGTAQHSTTAQPTNNQVIRVLLALIRPSGKKDHHSRFTDRCTSNRYNENRFMRTTHNVSLQPCPTAADLIRGSPSQAPCVQWRGRQATNSSRLRFEGAPVFLSSRTQLTCSRRGTEDAGNTSSRAACPSLLKNVRRVARPMSVSEARLPAAIVVEGRATPLDRHNGS